MNKLIILLISFNFISCALVDSYHRKFDGRESNNQMPPNKRRKQTNAYDHLRAKDKRPIENPITYSNIRSTNSHQSYAPPVKRQYEAVEDYRYKAKDFVDDNSEGSLWTGKHSEGFIFTNHNVRNVGDIIVLQVQKPLQDKIDKEIETVFKRRKKKGKKPASTNKTAAKKDPEEKKPTPAVAAKPGEEDPAQKVSAKIVEKINKDYILVSAVKEVMYRNIKRYVRIDSVVPKKDISHEDTINSSQLLETTVTVMR